MDCSRKKTHTKHTNRQRPHLTNCRCNGRRNSCEISVTKVMNFTAGTRKTRRRHPSPQEKVDHTNWRCESHLSAMVTTSPSSGHRCHGSAPTCTRSRKIHMLARQTNIARKGWEHGNHHEATDQNLATRGLRFRLSEQERGRREVLDLRAGAKRAGGKENGGRGEGRGAGTLISAEVEAGPRVRLSPPDAPTRRPAAPASQPEEGSGAVQYVRRAPQCSGTVPAGSCEGEREAAPHTDGTAGDTSRGANDGIDDPPPSNQANEVPTNPIQWHLGPRNPQDPPHRETGQKGKRGRRRSQIRWWRRGPRRLPPSPERRSRSHRPSSSASGTPFPQVPAASLCGWRSRMYKHPHSEGVRPQPEALARGRPLRMVRVELRRSHRCLNLL
jgi:hypothetical protein